MENLLAENYLLLKHLHMSAAVLSLLGFSLRGYWMLTDNRLLQAKPSKILPHIIDTLLLLAAVGLVLVTRQYPFQAGWVTLKLFMLIAYILVGTVALKRGKTKKIRTVALLISLVIILGIFAVAGIKPVF